MKHINLILTVIILAYSSATYAMEQSPTLSNVPADVMINNIIIPEINKAQTLEELGAVIRQGRTDKRYRSLMTDQRVQKAITAAEARLDSSDKTAGNIVGSLTREKQTLRWHSSQSNEFHVLATDLSQYERLLKSSPSTLNNVISLLKKNGVDIKGLDSSGSTALHIIQYELCKIDEKLREIVQRINKMGNTTRSDETYRNTLITTSNMYLTFAEQLLKRGIPVNQIDKNGNTALDIAISCNLTHNIPLLRKYGAQTAAEVTGKK